MAAGAEFKTIKEAETIVGGLSHPSKMPGLAYGLPARRCPIGAALAKVNGSVCSDCYALKGRYVFPNVQAAQERRFKTLKDPRWVDAMAWLIKRLNCRWFRWHDSGDLQGFWHLELLCEVARRCPGTHFWLPTRERATVRYFKGTVPPNLVIRMSGTMIDGPAPKEFANTSRVVSKLEDATCPAYRQNGKCGTCRACWSSDVPNINYPHH